MTYRATAAAFVIFGSRSMRLVRVLPDWSLAPVQVHAITETRLLPARTRLFIDFPRARLREP